MLKILKICFSIAVVVMLMPEDSITDQNGQPLNADTAVEITKAGIKNVSAFCVNNPQACLQGKEATSKLSQNTIKTARSIYDYLNETETEAKSLGLEKIENPKSLDEIAMQIASEKKVVNTLSMSDLNIELSEADLQ